MYSFGILPHPNDGVRSRGVSRKLTKMSSMRNERMSLTLKMRLRLPSESRRMRRSLQTF